MSEKTIDTAGVAQAEDTAITEEGSVDNSARTPEQELQYWKNKSKGLEDSVNAARRREGEATEAKEKTEKERLDEMETWQKNQDTANKTQEFEQLFDKGFNEALEELPGISNVINKEVIKTLVMNGSTVKDAIDKAYGNVSKNTDKDLVSIKQTHGGGSNKTSREEKTAANIALAKRLSGYM